MKKLDPKEMYNYFKEKHGSSEASQLVQLYIYGKSFYTCLILSEQRHGINAMPDTCLTILEEVY